ncbi:unnamed protein product, partial [Amoebophrya sp. A120]
ADTSWKPIVSGDAPSYVGVGQLDVTVKKDEIYLGQALKGGDLDWELFADSWESNFDLTVRLQQDLLFASRDRLKFIFCLSPVQITNLGSSILQPAEDGSGCPLREQTLQRIKQDALSLCCLFEGNASADERQEEARKPVQSAPKNDVNDGALINTESSTGIGGLVSHPEARKRWCAVKWLLWSVLPGNCDAFRLTFEELELLIRCHVKLCPRNRPDILQKLVEMLIGFDLPRNVLLAQTDVRDYLLKAKFK